MKPAIATVVFGLVLSLFSSVEAKSWRGIVPLQTTKAAVVQILGEGTESKIAVTKYHFENEDVSILYSNVHVGVAESACQLPPDLVLSITVFPKVQISLESLGLKRESLTTLPPPPDSPHTRAFIDDAGLVVSTNDGLQELVYLPSKVDRTRCKDFYGDLSQFVIKIPLCILCPPISVACPEETEAGNNVNFIASVVVGTALQETYNWTVDRGTILSGQGTPSITVDSNKLEGKTITATVEVGGIDPACPRTASCSTPIIKRRGDRPH